MMPAFSMNTLQASVVVPEINPQVINPIAMYGRKTAMSWWNSLL
jgi:hypothetical protein